MGRNVAVPFLAGAVPRGDKLGVIDKPSRGPAK
jgi:hypothetical protein